MNRLKFIFILSIIHLVTSPGKLKAQIQFPQNCDSDSCKARTLLDKAFDLAEAQPDSAIQLAKASLKITKTNSAVQGRAQQIIGISYDYKGILDSAIHHLQKSFTIYEKVKMSEKQSHVLNDIGLAYYFSGNYELALRNHFKALELRQAIGEKKFIAMSMHNIGIVYRSRKDYKNALRYYKESLALKKELNNATGILNTTINIGGVFQNLTEYDSALTYAQNSLELALKLGSPNDISIAYSNIATAYLGKNELALAEKYSKTCLEDSATAFNKQTLQTCYATLGEVAAKSNNYPLAIRNYQQALKIASSNKRLESMASYHQFLMELYKKTGDTKNALSHAANYIQYNDTLFKAENERQIAEMQILYETKEKESTIAGLNFKNQLVNKENEQSRKERNISIIFSTLLIIVIVGLYLLLRQNKKQRLLLSQQKNTIEKSLKEKELLIREVHHRVKNNLQMVSSLLSLQSRQTSDEYAKSALNESKTRIHAMGLIHQHLYNDDLQTGVPVHTYLQELLKGLTAQTSKSIQYQLECPFITLDVETVIPIGLIINELVTNSIKHAFPQTEHGQLFLSLTESTNGLEILYKDNGNVITNHEQLNKSNSFGMQMIRLFAKKLNATFTLEHQNGIKTVFVIPNHTKIHV
jgi:two-component system, sensor histidine kinase PdtaS